MAYTFDTDIIRQSVTFIHEYYCCHTGLTSIKKMTSQINTVDDTETENAHTNPHLNIFKVENTLKQASYSSIFLCVTSFFRHCKTVRTATVSITGDVSPETQTNHGTLQVFETTHTKKIYMRTACNRETKPGRGFFYACMLGNFYNTTQSGTVFWPQHASSLTPHPW